MKNILMFEGDFKQLSEREIESGSFCAKYYDEFSDITYFSRLKNDEEALKQHVKDYFDSRQYYHDKLLKIYQSKRSLVDKRQALWELGGFADHRNLEGKWIIETAIKIDKDSFEEFLLESGKFLYHKIKSRSL